MCISIGNRLFNSAISDLFNLKTEPQFVKRTFPSERPIECIFITFGNALEGIFCLICRKNNLGSFRKKKYLISYELHSIVLSNGIAHVRYIKILT